MDPNLKLRIRLSYLGADLASTSLVEAIFYFIFKNFLLCSKGLETKSKVKPSPKIHKYFIIGLQLSFRLCPHQKSINTLPLAYTSEPRTRLCHHQKSISTIPLGYNPLRLCLTKNPLALILAVPLVPSIIYVIGMMQ